MKALFFLYDGYVDWEISLLSYIFSETNMEIQTTALNTEITHYGNFRIKVDLSIEECNISNYDILIIPGGDPEQLINERKLIKLIQEFDQRNKWIATICGAATFLGMSSVLRNRYYSTSLEISEFPLTSIHYIKAKQTLQ
ncbi:DJ-1/PfpI family protein [Bacillus carboniphilus]|uniref:DJ-1/PfpI family protein n=1 Tax=Bacillus carboniphilus TaxID=86663 RepID=A0ABY9JRL2_9BACI|nr:DJ-1/PfpI family protein [Bacillus carboniphilus]WLR42026.1 DJ-1/PfpI family protein [Bacillus carboniphilus]